MKVSFKFSPEVESAMKEDIKRYFHKEHDQQLGDLKAKLFLDFISNSLGRYYYNQGVADAQKYMGDKVEDLFELQK